MDGNDIDWERLDRYVSGRGTPEDLKALERWVDADPELRRLADAMRAVGHPPGAAPRTWDARSAWQRVHRRMQGTGRTPLALTRPSAGDVRVARAAAGGWRGLTPRRAAAAAAAAVVIAVASSLLFTRSTPAPERDGTTQPEAMREVVTRRGERAVFDLLDGSRVVLAAESRLRIPASYARGAANARELYLEGEAYFRVEQDRARPFRVRAATGIAEDLGTEFIVTAYPETDGMQVVVASGVVALHRSTEPLEKERGADAAQPRPLLTLRRGDLARLDSAGTATLTRGVEIAPYLAWTDGSLVFNGAPLRDAIPRLARWYDLDITLADTALADRRLSATFRDESAAQVLELIELSLDLHAEQSGRAVTLSPKRPAQRAR